MEIVHGGLIYVPDDDDTMTIYDEKTGEFLFLINEKVIGEWKSVGNVQIDKNISEGNQQ